MLCTRHSEARRRNRVSGAGQRGFISNPESGSMISEACQRAASLCAGGSSQRGRAIFRLPGSRRTWRPIGKPAGTGLRRRPGNAEVKTGFILITRGNGQRQLGEDAHRPQHRPARAAPGWFGGHSHESSSLIREPAATRVFLAASGESGRQQVFIVVAGSAREPVGFQRMRGGES